MLVPASAAIVAPATGGRGVFTINANGQLSNSHEHITVYLTTLEPLPADTLKQRQHALILSWLAAHHSHHASHLSSTATPAHDTPQLLTTELGKPYWPSSPWQFNWSHSQGWLALAIAPRAWLAQKHRSTEAGCIGIDIESLGRARARTALVARYYHPDEYPGADTELGFLMTWTRKEAVVKAHGMGLRIALKSLNTRASIIEHAQLGRWHSLSLRVRNADSNDSADVAMLSLSWPHD